MPNRPPKHVITSTNVGSKLQQICVHKNFVSILNRFFVADS